MQLDQMSKGRRALMLAALFLSTMCTIGDMAIVPIMSHLYEVFADTNAVNFMLSGPSLIGLFFCLLGGRLADKVDKKLLLIIGFVIFALGGIFGALFVDLPYMTVCRLLCAGVAWGITSTAALGIIADLYTDEVRHGTIVGWYSSSMAAIGAVLSFVSGQLAVSGWQLAYHSYWGSIPVLIMIILFVPSVPPIAKEHGRTEGAIVRRGWWRKLVPLCAQYFIADMCGCIFIYLIALYVSDAGLGNEAFAGTLSSVCTITSCLACMAFGFIYGKLRRAVSIPPLAIIGCGYLLLWLFPNPVILLVCCVFMGAAWGTYYSYYFTHCTEVVPVEVQGTALGIATATNGLGATGYTFALTGIEGALGVTNCVPAYGVLGVVFLILAIISGIALCRVHRRRAA